METEKEKEQRVEEIIIDGFISREIICPHEENENWHYVTCSLAIVLEMFADVDVEFPDAMPPFWKRKEKGNLRRDPELRKAATAILEHRNELKAMEENK